MSNSDSISALNEDLSKQGLEGYWQSGRGGAVAAPVTNVKPHIWKWAQVYKQMSRAGEVIELKGYERRTVRLVNPGLEGWAYTAKTMHVSMQYIAPGEVAAAHRHTMAAIRFVVKGNGAYTTVDGQQCVMEEGDLILTPKLTWHDHTNNSSEPIIFLNGVDMPLVQFLDQFVQELYPERAQAITVTSTAANDLNGGAKPSGFTTPPLIHYKWRDTYAALETLRKVSKPDPFDGIIIDYQNRETGGPTLPSLNCRMQLLTPGEETRAHRHTSTCIYSVFKGEGRTFINGQAFDWEEGDVFVVPVWHEHRHVNRSRTDDALLFSLNDTPLLHALGLYQEEAV